MKDDQEEIVGIYYLALSMYLKEPCRICGQSIEIEDMKDLVYVGYSQDNLSRAAHGECYQSDLPKKRWAYSFP